MDSPTRLVTEWVFALSCFAIAGAFIPAALRGQDAWLRRFQALLSALFVLCGASQLAPHWTSWSGSDLVERLVLQLAAAVSLIAAFVMLSEIRKMLALPTTRAIAASNLELRNEVVKREGTEADLRRARSELEESDRALSREIAERESAEERFRLALEASPAGKVLTDGNGRIVLVNHAAEVIFDYPREDLIDQPIETLVPDRFKPVHPSHREGFLEKPAERPMGADRELFGLRADGSEVPIEISLNPIHTGEGNFVLAAIVDITERIHAQRLVQAKQAQLERTNRELDEFAHVVSHDLKAPLRGVISLSTWIAEDCAALLPKESHEHLKLLTQRTRRMSELIDGILHYSLAGRASSPAEPVEVSELVRDVIDSLAPPPSIRVRVEAPLPIVHYDRTQLRQVFQNLLANAIQHLGRPAGEVVVACREEPGAFEFSVSDDGVGIEERHFERIFRIFQALHPDAPTGGIGLAIVKKIVERNGGSAGVVSQPGAGASFRFSVPKASMGAETRLRRRRPPKEKSGEERTDPARRG